MVLKVLLKVQVVRHVLNTNVNRLRIVLTSRAEMCEQHTAIYYDDIGERTLIKHVMR